MVSAAQGKLNHCHRDTGGAQRAFECGSVNASASYTASFNDQDVLTRKRLALVQVLNATSYGFNAPSAVSSDGTYVWVTNESGNSLTELKATSGALVRVITGPGT